MGAPRRRKGTWQGLRLPSRPAPLSAALQTLGVPHVRVHAHTPACSQESLGFLATVMPRPVVQRMLSAAIRLGPLAAAEAAPAPEAAATAAAAVAAEALGAAAAAAAGPSQPCTPAARPLAELPCCGWARPPSPEAAPAPSEAVTSGKVAAVLPQPPANEPDTPGSDAAPGSPSSSDAALGSPTASALAGQLTVVDARQKVRAQFTSLHNFTSQWWWWACSCPCANLVHTPQWDLKCVHLSAGSLRSVRRSLAASPCGPHQSLPPQWNLEFADPGLELAFKDWFNTLQTVAGAPTARRRWPAVLHQAQAAPPRAAGLHALRRLGPPFPCSASRAHLPPTSSLRPTHLVPPPHPADLRVFRYYSALLLALFAALAWRGGLGLSDWLALGHGECASAGS